jgi:hypothetical protein
MRKILRWAYKDWERAPISGTMVLAAQFAGCYAFYEGNLDRGLLWLILGSIWIAQRGPLETDDEAE